MATNRNVHGALDQIEQLWSPHVVGEGNDSDVKVDNVAGDFAEHVHDDTDEFFLVLAGRLHLDLPDLTVTLDPMDLYTVPRGVRHRPRADAGTRRQMLEPRGARGTALLQEHRGASDLTVRPGVCRTTSPIGAP